MRRIKLQVLETVVVIIILSVNLKAAKLVDRILATVNNENIFLSDFEKIADWFTEFEKRYKNIELYDFLQDDQSWRLCQEISFGSNLSAPDVIHLASAIVGASAGYCEIFITNDKAFMNEAKKIISEYKLKSILKIMAIAEVKRKFFKK